MNNKNTSSSWGADHGRGRVALIIPVLGLGLLLAMPRPTAAAERTFERYWVCGSGDWADDACWSATDGGAGGDGQPQSGDSPFITSTDALDRTVTYDFDSGLWPANLLVNGTGSGTPTLQLSGGHMKHTNFAIGDTGKGVFTQTGGANEMYVGFYLGGEGGQGTFNLSGGSVSTGQGATVGGFGNGFFNQTGGTVNVTNSLFLGLHDVASGNYALGGTGGLTTRDTFVGREGAGSFVQTGGVHTVTRNLELGGFATADGAYEMNGGELSVGSVETIGNVGAGEFTQNGGSHGANGLQLGSFTGTGTFNLHGGSLSTGWEVIGTKGNGVFNQTGGIHTVAIEMRLGVSFAGGESTYNLSGGELNADREYIGGIGRPGNFNQSGGTNNVTTGLSFAAPGGALSRYQLSGGDLNVSSGFIFGAGRGIMNIDGGTLTLSSNTFANITDLAQFNVGHSAGSTGVFTLHNNQSLNASNETVGHDGNGIFTQLGGVNKVYETVTIAANPGSGGTYYLYSGSLDAFNFENNGNFFQFGGLNRVRQTLTIAAEPSSTGIYNLHAGTLSAANVQNNGTFNILGGSLNITDPMGAFRNGRAQGPAGTDPNAHLNIDNTSVVINGDVINYGTVKVTDANVSFNNGTFTNNGPYVSDPSESFFADLVVGETGYLVGGAGDNFFVSGDFLNFSQRSTLWDTAGAYLGFTGAGPHEFRLADALDPADFAWGTLELAGGSSLTLTNGGTGLLIANLILGAGTSLDLNGFDLFVNTLTDNGGTYTGGDIIFVSQPVPLPPAWLLMLAGLPVLSWRRRTTRGPEM